MKIFFKLFRFMKPHCFTYIPGLIMYSSQRFIFPLVSSVFMSLITAAVTEGDAPGVMRAAIIYMCMYVAIMPLLAFGVMFYNSGVMKATRDLKAALFRRFVKTSLEASQLKHSGEGIAVINTDADNAAYVYGNTLAPLLSCVISIVFSVLVVFLIDYRLGFASVGVGLVAFAIQYRFAKPMGEIGEQRLSVNAASVRRLSDILQGAAAIRAMNAQEKIMISFDTENGKLRTLSFRQAFISMWQSLFTTVQGWLSLACVFALGGYLVATKRLSFPALMMVPNMCDAIAAGMSGIGGAWAAMQAPPAAGKRVFDILESGEPEMEPANSERDARDSHEPDSSREGYALKLKNIDFKYLNTEKNALNGVTLEIGENEMVAFVGESGSGKSTLLRLIIGMYERDSFDMRLGSAPFTRRDIIKWRERFAYVDQSLTLFNMTVAENIGLGRKASAPDDIKEAASLARADAFITELPNGYDTPCGEKGASLSGGQKQRIAIARALVRKAPVLVFDEATSALDAETERQLMDTINNLRGSHTILITTHNLNNIVSADKIVVMDKGRVAETGRHDELMQKNGLYKRLFTGA